MNSFVRALSDGLASCSSFFSFFSFFFFFFSFCLVLATGIFSGDGVGRLPGHSSSQHEVRVYVYDQLTKSRIC
jgi:hypothetical protein